MKTPLEELLSIVEELKSKNQEIDTNGLEDWINSVGIPKEREQFIRVTEALTNWCVDAYNEPEEHLNTEDYMSSEEYAGACVETFLKYYEALK